MYVVNSALRRNGFLIHGDEGGVAINQFGPKSCSEMLFLPSQFFSVEIYAPNQTCFVKLWSWNVYK